MTIALNRTDPHGADREALVTFHTSADFPFHVRAHPTRADLERAVDRGDTGPRGDVSLDG